jgi:hypothetical protein
MLSYYAWEFTQSIVESTNSDMSPKKSELQKGSFMDIKASSKEKHAPNDTKPKKPETRGSRLDFGVVRQQLENDVPQTVEISLDTPSVPPKTPAIPHGPLSPISTEPSATRPENRDTPPPADLALSDSQQLGARPSRRARASVNYAEPNLISKMRRPTAEMVDAVAKDARRSLSSSLVTKKDEGGSAPLTVEKPRNRTVVIKRERDDEHMDWKNVPEDKQESASPLSKKTIEAVKVDDKKDETGSSADAKFSGSGAAISALIAGGSKIKKRPSSRLTHDASHSDGDVERLSGRLDNMAIYDFTESSPTGTSTEGEDAGKTRADAIRARQGRRHSSILGLSVSRENSSGTGTALAGHRSAAEMKASRTVLSSSVSNSSAASKPADDKSRGPVLGYKMERTSTRRRSMML